ncbi:MAG: hypothetical protein PHI85_04000 [Victivallaceae bacterium]|nr:hypothetical protein [Victivallaceae bacterium]
MPPLEIPEALSRLIATLRNREAFCAEWQARAASLTRAKARGKHPDSDTWGRIADAVKTGAAGGDRSVYLDGGQEPGRIGIHKQEGGEIRARNGRNLAIPFKDKESIHHGKPPSLFGDGDLEGRLFAVGNGRNAVLGFNDGEKFIALWLLTPRVKQRAEPWWPEDDEVLDAGTRTVEHRISVEAGL